MQESLHRLQSSLTLSFNLPTHIHLSTTMLSFRSIFLVATAAFAALTAAAPTPAGETSLVARCGDTPCSNLVTIFADLQAGINKCSDDFHHNYIDTKAVVDINVVTQVVVDLKAHLDVAIGSCKDLIAAKLDLSVILTVTIAVFVQILVNIVLSICVYLKLVLSVCIAADIKLALAVCAQIDVLICTLLDLVVSLVDVKVLLCAALKLVVVVVANVKVLGLVHLGAWIGISL